MRIGEMANSSSYLHDPALVTLLVQTSSKSEYFKRSDLVMINKHAYFFAFSPTSRLLIPR